MSSPRALLFSALSGLMLFFAWPVDGFPFLIFFAFIPLLWVESSQHAVNRQFFMLALLTTLIWNLGTTWWIYNASPEGSAMAIIANAILMAAVFYIFHLARIKFGPMKGYLILVLLWMTFEWQHFRWDICWPWLNLGNSFAGDVFWIQWYEFTGQLGGTLWIWLMNISLFAAIKRCLDSGWQWRLFLAPFLIFAIPTLVSAGIWFTFSEKDNPVRVSVIQPNIDPYTEKFNGVPAEVQLSRILQLAVKNGLDSVDLLVGPETALVNNVWENELELNDAILSVREFMKPYPELSIIMGASTTRLFQPGEKISQTARKLGNSGRFYDAFNTALHFKANAATGIYHKSKLVPGVEKMPWPFIFKYIEAYAIDLGGTSGSLGTQDSVSVFKLKKPGIVAAPAVCYESVFGDYLAGFVRAGANLLVIITNDGWWGNTPGFRQHLAYGSLRAIEFRRSIVRSANTGISALINQRGQILDASSWWEPQVIKGSVNANNKLTLYARFGDYLGQLAIIALLIITPIFWFNNYKSSSSRKHGKI